MEDFLFDTITKDLSIVSGDLDIGNSDGQHLHDLLFADKGSIKEFMDTGVGIRKYMEDENTDALRLEMRLQFTADGMDVKENKYNEQTEKFQIDASYHTI